MFPPTLPWSTPLILSCLLFLSPPACAQDSSQTFFPASIPLAIRSPYMNLWHPSTNTSDPLSNAWPLLWRQTGDSSSVGWAGKFRVDGQTYAWMGHDLISTAGPANVTNTQITPTRSIFAMQAGPMNFTVTFLTPIEPSDWVRQSLPFFYVYLEGSSLDGAPHSVQVYWDGTGEILSGNKSSSIQWSQDILNTGSSVYHEVELQEPQPYVEYDDQAQDGKAFYAISIRPGLTWQVDAWQNVDGQFRDHDTLTDIIKTDFGPISSTFNAFGLAVDLGNITSTSSPVVWSLGYVRDPLVNYTTPAGMTQQRRPFFTSQYSRMGDAIDAFTGDFTGARNRAIALDDKIMQDAAKISPEYVDLVSLAARQAFGALDITVGSDSNGGADLSDIKMFMKDIGTSIRTNPVERIFAAFPAFIYLNASMGGGLLKPLLESQDNLTTPPYALQDMGVQYPNAEVVPGPHGSGIEQTGNMLIMMYAHARVSGDGSLLAQHYNLTKRWGDYLVGNALTPTNQLSADAEIVGNMTNLALKGIIGVKAMAEISRALGEDFDAQQYDSHASALIGSWQSLAMSSDNKTPLGVYGDQQSWSLLYNLYADRLLGTNLVPDSIREGQTQQLSSLLSTGQQFGPPIDSTIGSKSSAAWTLFTAAIVTDTGVRDELIRRVRDRTGSNITAGAFPDVYSSATGETISGTAGPALGAMFSILALTVPNTTIVVPGTGNVKSQTNDVGAHKASHLGPIVGGVVGGLAVVALAVGAFLYFRRRQRKRQRRVEIEEKLDLSYDPYVGQSVSYTDSGMHQTTSAGYVVVPWTEGVVTPHAHAPAYALADAGGARGSGMPSPPDAGEARRLPATPVPHTPDTQQSRLSKAREVEFDRQNRYAEVSESAGSAVFNEAFATPASSRDVPSLVDGGGGGDGDHRRSVGVMSSGRSVTPTEVRGLMGEVERLRRVVNEIWVDRRAPPPEYSG